MKKRLAILLCTLRIMMTGVGCSNSSTSVKKNEPSPEISKKASVSSQKPSTEQPLTQNVLNINTSQDLLDIYYDVDSLYAASDFVIKGEIVAAEVKVENLQIYTYTKVKVLDDLSNNVGVDTIIDVIFRGGAIEGAHAKKFNLDLATEKYGADIPKDIIVPDKVVQKISNLDNMEKGDTVLLFLQDKSDVSNGKDKYVLTGAYQGRFKIKDNKAELHPELSNAANNDILSEDKKSIKADALIKKIKEIKKQK